MSRILEGRNRANASEGASFVAEIERQEQEFLSFKMGKLGEIAAAAAKLTERRNEILDDAKSQGVPKQVVKKILKSRAHKRKSVEEAKLSESVIDDLEDDDRAYAVDIRKALGDFADSPLGAAAVGREDTQDPTTAAIVDAASKHWNDADPKAAKRKH